MKVLPQLLIVAALAGVGGGGWYFKDRLPFDVRLPGGATSAEVGAGFAARAVVVETMPVRRGEVKMTVEAVGTAKANEAVEVTGKVTGIVERIHFREGQRVAAGAVLVKLDTAELEAELEEERAARDNAQRLYERARKLLAGRNVSEARVDELYARLQAAEARVRANEARVAEYVIRAPFAGRLGLREVSPGALIRPGTRITTLDDTTTIKLDFEVPETALARLVPGLDVSAQGVAIPGRVFFGKVTTVDSRLDPATRSVRVRAKIPNPDDALKPGMFLTVTLVLGVKRDAVLVPEEAVVTAGAGQFVYVVRDGKAVRTRVVLGQRLPGEVEALVGLEPGDLVVVGGVQKLRDGAPVRSRNVTSEADGGEEPGRMSGREG